MQVVCLDSTQMMMIIPRPTPWQTASSPSVFLGFKPELHYLPILRTRPLALAPATPVRPDARSPATPSLSSSANKRAREEAASAATEAELKARCERCKLDYSAPHADEPRAATLKRWKLVNQECERAEAELRDEQDLNARCARARVPYPPPAAGESRAATLKRWKSVNKKCARAEATARAEAKRRDEQDFEASCARASQSSRRRRRSSGASSARRPCRPNACGKSCARATTRSRCHDAQTRQTELIQAPAHIRLPPAARQHPAEKKAVSQPTSAQRVA